MVEQVLADLAAAGPIISAHMQDGRTGPANLEAAGPITPAHTTTTKQLCSG